MKMPCAEYHYCFELAVTAAAAVAAWLASGCP